MKEDDRARVLEVVFPGRTIPLAEGEDSPSVTLRPLSLKDLPGVLKVFEKLVHTASAVDPAVLAITCLEDILKLLPLCMDRQLEDIPAHIAPVLVAEFIKQNISMEIVGKWTGLLEEIGSLLKEQAVKPVGGKTS